MPAASPDGAAGDTRWTVARRGLLAFVTAAAIVLVFVDTAWLTLLAVFALVLYLVLGWRRFTMETWVPVFLSIGALVLSLQRGVSGTILMEAAERTIFLAALTDDEVTLIEATYSRIVAA